MVTPAHSNGKIDEDHCKEWHQNEGSNETWGKGLRQYRSGP